MTTREHIEAARRQVRRESRRLDRKIAALIPLMHPEVSELARRWLSKDA